MKHTRRVSRVIVALLALTILSTACGGDDDADDLGSETPAAAATPSLATVTVTAEDGSLAIPSSIEAVPTSFVLENDGTKPYEAKFARLNEGVTMKDLQASLREGPDAALSLITLAGEIRRTAPGDTDELTAELAPGDYVVVDPAFAGQGMVMPFEVVAGAADADEPEADVEVSLTDFAMDMPSTLPAGKVTVKVVNNGGQAHELFLLAEGEKPGPRAPGVTPFNPGSTVWAELDLEPGTYTAVCYFPDAKSGKPHVALGMKEMVVVE
ncbi:MAG TPA: hypothetical protein VFS18_04755 [Actinomycetota bacterium]|nr:hypothetical protein [Actinomycetota bacterium]